VGLRNLDKFAWVGQFDGFGVAGWDLEKQVPGFLKDPASVNRKLRLLFLGCGTEDPRYQVNLRLVDVFKRNQIRHEFHASPGDHEWKESSGIFSPSSCRSCSAVHGEVRPAGGRFARAGPTPASGSRPPRWHSRQLEVMTDYFLAGVAVGGRSVRRPFGPLQAPSSTSSGVIQANCRSTSAFMLYFFRTEAICGPRMSIFAMS